MTGSSLKFDARGDQLEGLLAEIRACRVCADAPIASPLPHEPRPVLRASASARLLIAGQAPGIRVHRSGLPYTDPSGDRLRRWMGVDEDVFYDPTRIAIVPMGFCFPGWDGAGGDLPPRRECRARWHDRLFALMPAIELVLIVGSYARDYHFARLGVRRERGESLSKSVARWREFAEMRPALLPLPHPSWRNNAWLKRHPWFESELLPDLRRRISDTLTGRD